MINQWRRRVAAIHWNLLELVPADYSFPLFLSLFLSLSPTLSLSDRQCLKDNCVPAFLGEVDDGFFILILNGMSSMLRGLVNQLNAFRENSKRRISIKSWREQMRSDAWRKYCDTRAASYLRSRIANLMDAQGFLNVELNRVRFVRDSMQKQVFHMILKFHSNNKCYWI